MTSVGSLGKYPNEEDVKGIVWRDCTLNGTTNGARIKTWPGSPPSQASSIIYQDIVMNDVKNPIIIDQKYGSHLAKVTRFHFFFSPTKQGNKTILIP